MTIQKEKIFTCTLVLFIMVFLAAIINRLICVNISIAILDMIQQPINSTNGSREVSRFYQGNETRFDWNGRQKNTLLGSFFWGYLIEAYGGYLADTWGPKIVFGYGMLLSGCITVLTPLFAIWHYYAILVLRILLGVVIGGTLTSMMPLASQWIPTTKRSTFLSLLSGSSFGTLIALPLFGYLIFWYGWASVFYISGVICIVYSCLWFYLIYDSPNKHPRISIKEKAHLNLILDNTKKYKKQKPKTVPWRQLLSSKPVWAAALASSSSVQILFFVLTHLPNYMDAVHKMNIRNNGLYSSLPYIGLFLMTLIYSIIADKMIESKKYTILTVRKLFSTLSLLFPSIFLALQMIYGDVKWACVLLFSLTLFFKSASVCGPVANILDIAPNYGGTIIGIDATVASVSMIIINEVIGILTKTHNTFEQWKYIPLIFSVTNLLTYVFFMVFAEDKVQSWNSSKKEIDIEDMEKSSLENLNA